MITHIKYIFSLLIVLASLIHAQIASVWFVEQDNSLHADAPVTFGHVFAQGDVPSGTSVEARSGAGALLPTQVDAKAFHADGSLRHAVITVSYTHLTLPTKVSV